MVCITIHEKYTEEYTKQKLEATQVNVVQYRYQRSQNIHKPDIISQMLSVLG